MQSYTGRVNIGGMLPEQKIRAILYYLSLLTFFLGLPFILSGALGYKFDPHTFKFTKTGLLSLKTQPAGAAIYLGEKILNPKTPASLEELLPGKYNLKVELEGYYPWIGDVLVEAGKVTRVEKIILFPLRPLIKQLNIDRLTGFWIDEEKNNIYYADEENGNIYSSDLGGGRYEKIATCLPEVSAPRKYKVSGDRNKVAYFNRSKIGVSFCDTHKELVSGSGSFVVPHPDEAIIDIFWHSDSYHLVVITNSSIEVLEAQPNAVAVSLVKLNKKNVPSFYDKNTDVLYFLDSQLAQDGKTYDNLYQLKLENRSSPF